VWANLHPSRRRFGVPRAPRSYVSMIPERRADGPSSTRRWPAPPRHARGLPAQSSRYRPALYGEVDLNETISVDREISAPESLTAGGRQITPVTALTGASPSVASVYSGTSANRTISAWEGARPISRPIAGVREVAASVAVFVGSCDVRVPRVPSSRRSSTRCRTTDPLLLGRGFAAPARLGCASCARLRRVPTLR
jgi:hypothetical protein